MTVKDKITLTFALIFTVSLFVFGYFFLGGVFGSTTFGVSLNVNPDLERGLVGHWTFDGKDIIGDTGNGILDRSGQGNHGQLVGNATTTAQTFGVIGQALEFDGSNDYVELYNPSSLQTFSEMTIASWFYWTGTTTDHYMILSKSSGGYYMDVVNKKLFFRASDLTSDTTQGASTLQNNRWYHALVTYDGSFVKLYLNGALDGSEESSGTISNTVTDLHVGTDFNYDLFFEGSLDDVRIYNRALSPDEISRLYDLGATTKVGKTINTNPDLESGLVGHWTFDGKDITADQILDRSGQGNHGGFIGGATTSAATEGAIGQAFQFDGVDDYINTGDVSALRPSQVTSCAWARRTNTDTNAGIVSTWVSNTGYLLWNDPSGVFEFPISAASHLSSGVSLTIGEWFHLCGTFDGTTAKTYVDGVFKTQQADTLTYTGGQQFNIGRYANVNSTAFTGDIDDVRIYNRALSAEEVSRLYSLGATTKVGKTLATLDEGLVGHWTFDGPDITADQILDRSGQGNHGGFFGGSTTTAQTFGVIGQALEFDGVDDFVTAGDINTLDGISKMTISAWAKTNDISGDGESIVSKTPGGSTNRFVLSQGGSGYGNPDDVVVAVTDTSNRYGYTTGDIISVGEWNYYTMVFDGTLTGDANRLKLFQNGIQQTLTFGGPGIPSTTSGSNTGDLLIGDDPEIAGREFNGTIDDVRVYNRALSVQEIQRLYDLGR